MDGFQNEVFLHCQNCDSLAAVVVAHFDLHLAGRHLAVIRRAEDCFCRLCLWFVINILQNKFKFNPRSLKKFIKRFVFEILVTGDHSSTSYLFDKNVWVVTFLVSKLGHFENDIHFFRDIYYAVTFRHQNEHTSGEKEEDFDSPAHLQLVFLRNLQFSV